MEEVKKSLFESHSHPHSSSRFFIRSWWYTEKHIMLKISQKSRFYSHSMKHFMQQYSCISYSSKGWPKSKDELYNWWRSSCLCGSFVVLDWDSTVNYKLWTHHATSLHHSFLMYQMGLMGIAAWCCALLQYATEVFVFNINIALLRPKEQKYNWPDSFWFRQFATAWD